MMNVHKIIDNSGTLFAFELENAYISPNKIVEILNDINGVKSVELCKKEFLSTEILIKFCFQGFNLMVMEPFGDNDMYWIGPEGDEKNAEIVSIIMSAFKDYEPPSHKKIVGDILTKGFNSIFKK